MCLAIAMYLITGLLTVLFQISLALSIFLLNLLGKVILFVCAIIYTVGRPIQWPGMGPDSQLSIPFETMYPEYDFEDNIETMTQISLETITSRDQSTDDPSTEFDAISEPSVSTEVSALKYNIMKGIFDDNRTFRLVNRSIDVLSPNTQMDKSNPAD